MKKKNTVGMVLAFALAGAVLTGCGEGRDAQQDGVQGISLETQEGTLQETQEDTPEETQETPEGAQQESTEAAAEEPAEETPETQQGAQQDAQQESASDEAAAESAAQESRTGAGYEDNFAVDSKAAKEFAQKIQAAAADKDLEALAALMAFPVYVGLPDAKTVESREDFLALGAETVFTEGLLESLANADVENLNPSMAGFSLSGGGTANINFGVRDGVLAINGINY